jgi:ribosome biogenesis GTPase / thiamine phosphate phosphatase
MDLQDLGFTSSLAQYKEENGLDSFEVGRVISEHRERYIVRSEVGEYEAEILGNLRFSAQSREDFPAVGDWVAIQTYDADKALIHSIFPRKSSIKRLAVGSKGEAQIIATNIDIALIVQAVGRDFNLNRLDRYLTICYESKVEPIILLNKIDLIEKVQLADLLEKVRARNKDVQILGISNLSNQGIEDVKKLIKYGKTYCLLGSSGVGKSTLLNKLLGEEFMKTGAISKSVNRGKHITTHRELKVLKSGGIIIDNPGMREVGITDSSEGLEKTFEEIMELTYQCKFKDCRHISEVGCAVIQAVEDGTLEVSAYENFLKMKREKEHYSSTIAEKRQKDKKFGKMYKEIMKNKKSNKY